jgi:hypothetical protein
MLFLGDVAMARGKKNCPNCGAELGARTHLCECGYHFPSQRIRKDLLEAREEEAKKGDKKVLGRGRKQCPNCQKIVGVRTRVCECGYNFSIKSSKTSKKAPVTEINSSEPTEENSEENSEESLDVAPKTKREIENEEIIAYFNAHPHEASRKMTKREYAEEILSKGTHRALFLFNYARRHKVWPHVDWDHVAEQLGIEENQVTESQEEEKVEL